MFDIIYTSDNIHLKCFGCEKLVWNRDTVKYFNVSCVRKWAEVPPKSVTVFAKNIVQKDGGGGVLDFWVCCENDTIFFLKCFIGGQKLPFLYISPKYLRCKKILDWDNLGTQSFVLDAIFTRNCKMPQQTAMAYYIGSSCLLTTSDQVADPVS